MWAVLEHRDGREETLLDQTEVIGMTAGTERAGIWNEIKLANVFGRFTSLNTGIELMVPIDLNRFEESLVPYQERIIQAIQKLQNHILEAAGAPKVWKTDGTAAAPPKSEAPAPDTTPPPTVKKRRIRRN